MQGSSSSCPPPEAIIKWLKDDMGYMPHQDSLKKVPVLPSPEAVRKICKGNMIPVFNFLIARARSEKVARDVRRNLFVYGKSSNTAGISLATDDHPMTPDWETASSSYSEVSTPPRLRRGSADESRRRRGFPVDERRATGLEDRLRRASADDRPKSLERVKKAGSSKSSGGDRTPGSDLGPDTARVRHLAVAEGDAAAFDIARLRAEVRRTGGEMSIIMDSIMREEAEKEASTASHSIERIKKTVLEAYDWRLEQETALLKECLAHIERHLAHARQAGEPLQPVSGGDDARGKRKGSFLSSSSRLGSAGSMADVVGSSGAGEEGGTDDSRWYESKWERSVRQACEAISAKILERIQSQWAQYEGTGTGGVTGEDGHGGDLREGGGNDAEAIGRRVRRSLEYKEAGPQGSEEEALEKLRLEEVHKEVRAKILGSVRKMLERPGELLRAAAAYAGGHVVEVTREREKMDIRMDAERLRYNYENGRVTAGMNGGGDVAEESGGDWSVADVAMKGMSDRSAHSTFQLIQERQAAHVKMFTETEAARKEITAVTEDLTKQIRSLEENGRREEVEVWGREREVAGLQACLGVLSSEYARLVKLREERRSAEEVLQHKWKQIEQFEGRRRVLDQLAKALARANEARTELWETQLSRAQAQWAAVIPPLGAALQFQVSSSRDLIAREVESFAYMPHTHMLPRPPQLYRIQELESESASHSSSSDSASSSLLTKIPSIHRITVARLAGHAYKQPQQLIGPLVGWGQLRVPAGEAPVLPPPFESGPLAEVLRSLHFLHPPFRSPGSLLASLADAVAEVEVNERLSRFAIASVQEQQDRVDELSQALTDCSFKIGTQDMSAKKIWLPRIRESLEKSRAGLADVDRIKSLMHEWFHEPAQGCAPWVEVDGKNEEAWRKEIADLAHQCFANEPPVA